MKPLLMALLTLGAFPLPTAAQVASRPVVYVVNYPLQFFAHRIAGDFAQIVFPAPADVDPAYWVPDEATLLGYQQADLILLNGAGYEGWSDTISLPLNRVVNTTESLAARYIYSDDVVTHTHGPGGEHAHENLAFTTWLDLQMAAAQARRIAGALVGLMPQHENTLMRNLDSLVAELEQLDAGFAAIGERFGRQPLLASHPVYQYFARRYGFDLQSVHWEAEELPPLQEWQKLELLLEKHPAKWMIWEAQPLPEIHDGLSRLGVTPLVFQPLAHRPAHGDFLSAMKSNVQTLGQMLTVVP